jgi:hypothetical protein
MNKILQIDCQITKCPLLDTNDFNSLIEQISGWGKVNDANFESIFDKEQNKLIHECDVNFTFKSSIDDLIETIAEIEGIMSNYYIDYNIIKDINIILEENGNE